MVYFLSTYSIEKAYEELTKYEISDSSILHIFFILKACGINSIGYEQVNVISEKGLVPAKNLSSLFTPIEILPEKYDFISPFSMKKWENQAPSELLKKWVNGRIKNNVIGGATTWRRIIEFNAISSEIKFKHNYINEIIDVTVKSKKINLFALSIWANRFTKFPKKATLIEISNIFKKQFNINEIEEYQLFTKNNSNLVISYEEIMHDSAHIRKLIGLPSNIDKSWLKNSISSNQSLAIMSQEEKNMISDFIDNSTSFDTIFKLLNMNYQIILSGPPGTSKSYIANKISEIKFNPNNIISIQFHPKYSYHDFIGGYIVDGTNVKYHQGILPVLAKKALENKNEEFLLIIDEINRANVSQVLGETIQCLDRNNTTKILEKGVLTDFKLPKNLKIIGTMNTSDRSIGNIDFAVKRRFITIYCPPKPDILIELCENDFNISFTDLLRIINYRLFKTLKNKELAIGHTFFLDDNFYKNDKFKWNIENFELIFNYKILPLIEDYTKGNISQLIEIIGGELYKKLSGTEFKSALDSFINNDN
jgi:5-methylcytosine-specific restriction protein B